MQGSEERPSKVRKLNSLLPPEDNIQNVTSAMVGSNEDKHLEATQSMAGDNDVVHSELPFQDIESKSFDTNLEDDGRESSQSQPISKNQLKKIRRKQEWEAGKEYRKARRKGKEKEKKARKAEERLGIDQIDTGKAVQVLESTKKSHQRPIQTPITFMLDCDFDELMNNKSAPFRVYMVISSFGGKLKTRFETILANNHLSWKGVNFTDADFVSAASEADDFMRSSQGGRLSGALSESLAASKKLVPSASCQTETSEVEASQVMNKEPATLFKTLNKLENPEIRSTNTIPPEKQTLAEASPDAAEHGTVAESANISKENNDESIKIASANLGDEQDKSAAQEPSIVYLTSDSPNTLEVLSPYTTYVIGGLVDKNRHKGICYKRACERSMPTAKLPIGKYMTMQSRTVLATNHVMEIMLRWLEDGDWGKAFLRVIPKRKEAKLKVMAENDVAPDGKQEDNLAITDKDIVVNDD